ncbi:MAG: glycosyltransferase [Patescibacteria group bacterium]
MKFSIIIPTYNRNRSLLRLVGQLMNQNYKKDDYEIIVVDNGCDINCQRELEKLKSDFLNIYYFKEHKPGQSFSRNMGIKKSNFDTVICIDDDCSVKKNFLLSYANSWTKHKDAVIIGGKIVADINNKSEKKWLIDQFPWCFGATVCKKTKELQLGEFVFGGNISFKKNLVGSPFFNTMFGRTDRRKIFTFGGEDYELCTRMILKNRKIFFDKNIVVTNHVNDERFSYSYIATRFYFVGKETAAMDELLSKDFENYSMVGKRISWFINDAFIKSFGSFNTICQCIYMTSFLYYLMIFSFLRFSEGLIFRLNQLLNLSTAIKIKK